MSVRVMLVDDHPVVRAGVRAVVEAHPDLTVVAEAADGAEAIGVLEAGEPAVDVVLMDLQMGAGMDGVTATRAVRATGSTATSVMPEVTTRIVSEATERAPWPVAWTLTRYPRAAAKPTVLAMSYAEVASTTAASGSTP